MYLSMYMKSKLYLILLLDNERWCLLIYKFIDLYCYYNSVIVNFNLFKIY